MRCPGTITGEELLEYYYNTIQYYCDHNYYKDHSKGLFKTSYHFMEGCFKILTDILRDTSNNDTLPLPMADLGRGWTGCSAGQQILGGNRFLRIENFKK